MSLSNHQPPRARVRRIASGSGSRNPTPPSFRRRPESSPPSLSGRGLTCPYSPWPASSCPLSLRGRAGVGVKSTAFLLLVPSSQVPTATPKNLRNSMPRQTTVQTIRRRTSGSSPSTRSGPGSPCAERFSRSPPPSAAHPPACRSGSPSRSPPGSGRSGTCT